MLRNDFRLTSVKGAARVAASAHAPRSSTAKLINTCLYLAVWAEGKHIITLEGLMNPDGTLSDVQKAFMDETSIQCGFCTPGFILTATEIVNSGKGIQRRRAAQAALRPPVPLHRLSEHLPRCEKTMLRRLGKTEEAENVR